MILKRRPEIESFLKGPPRAVRAAVIYGRNIGIVREYAASLAKAVTDRPDDPFDTAHLTERDLDSEGGRLEGELAALSMMGGRRLVTLRIIGEKSGPARTAMESRVAALLGEHAAGKLNPEAFFIVESVDLTPGSPLRKTAEKSNACAVIPCYDDETADVAQFTRDALAKDGLSLEGDALKLFIDRMPQQRGVVRQEIERLSLFLGPGRSQPGTAAELTDFLGVEPESSLSEAALDAFGARAAAAQSHLRRAAAEGEGGPSAVRALSQQAGRLRKILTLTAAGADAREAAKSSGVFWKNEREVLRQARAWTAAALEDLAPDLLAADRACKTTGTPAFLIAERTAMMIAGRARRLGL